MKKVSQREYAAYIARKHNQGDFDNVTSETIRYYRGNPPRGPRRMSIIHRYGRHLRSAGRIIARADYVNGESKGYWISG